MDLDERLYLGFDVSCARCSSLAQQIEREAGDLVTVVPLGSPRMDQWRHDTLGEDSPWTPTLVRVQGDSVEAWVGWRITPVLMQRLGVRRTWRLLGILGDESTSGKQAQPGASRRRFLRTGLGAVAALGLLASTKQAAYASAAASAEDGAPIRLAGDELAHSLASVRAEQSVVVAERGLTSAGYQLVSEPAGQVVFRLKDGQLRTFLFFKSRRDPVTHAGVVAVEAGFGGETKISAAIVTGDPTDLATLTFEPVSADTDVEPLSPADYLGCMVICLATSCPAEVVLFCAGIPFLWATLACLVGGCGQDANRCHNDPPWRCRDAW